MYKKVFSYILISIWKRKTEEIKMSVFFSVVCLIIDQNVSDIIIADLLKIVSNTVELDHSILFFGSVSQKSSFTQAYCCLLQRYRLAQYTF
jgi:hypothetical protein